MASNRHRYRTAVRGCIVSVSVGRRVARCVVSAQLRLARYENDRVAAALTCLSDNVMLQLCHGNEPTRAIILYNAKHLKATRRIAIGPDVHPVNDLACAATTFYDGIASLVRLDLSVSAAHASCHD